MIAENETIEAEKLKTDQKKFQDILSDEELEGLFAKYNVKDERKRKLWVRWFFWLMVFSADEPSRRGSLLQLIGFFLGAIALLYPERMLTSLSKEAVSKRLKSVSWYLFRGVYIHLLNKYKELLDVEEMRFLGQFKEAFAIDGSVISLSKQMERVFQSVHKGKAALKLNTKYCLQVAAVTKLQVTEGKRHDSRFSFVTKAANCLYIVDLGYWSFRLMDKIIDAGSFFVMRLKRSCDPLIVSVTDQKWQHLVGSRLSDISSFLQANTAAGSIDLTVQLSKAKKPRFNTPVRLVGLFHDQQWHFYVTNIDASDFTPQLIYQLYALRWQVEIFFNLIKNVLKLDNIISRNKNGIMIEIYSALILYLITRIIIALAAQTIASSIHSFSFERSHKLIRGFLLSHFHRFLQASLASVDEIWHTLILIVSNMGRASKPPQTAQLLELVT